MKKSLLALFAILIFIGCSKDDDESFDITFKKSELIETYTIAGFYVNDNISLAVSMVQLLDYDNKESKFASCESKCPNHNNHNKSRNIKVASYYLFKCEECNAEFNPFTGNPINDEGKGYRLKVYKTSYDEVSETYRVWK